jgi:hypothetical protein
MERIFEFQDSLQSMQSMTNSVPSRRQYGHHFLGPVAGLTGPVPATVNRLSLILTGHAD